MDEGSIGNERQQTNDGENPKLPPPTISKEDSRFQNMVDDFNKGKIYSYELSDIVGYVYEFSQDYVGSRFIQIKLETAAMKDKNELFLELKPRALALSKDKFGNYVIQKFFEHGTALQIKELAEKLFGHVYTLSFDQYGCKVIQKFFEHGTALQIKELAEKLFGQVYTLSFDQYGCRVIQKALEVVDMDQKIRIVRELDDHVATCLYDHKANRVIEKCVECVPEEHTRVIVSVCIDQIVKLAQQTNGAHFIKTILRCCKNPLTLMGVVDGIVPSVVILANHPSANYLLQFMLEYGNPGVRSKIFEKLAGNIVEMSLNMYGSKVIEKCLDFGSHCDRQLIVNEILGSTDGKEPLETMMKDQFGNCIVHQILQRCDDENRELILSRIKIHGLEKYWFKFFS